MARYQKILEKFMEKPWAILPAKLAQISELLVFRANGGFMTPDEIRQAIELEPYFAHAQEARAQRAREKSGGKVAIIPLYGVITPRADLFSNMSGGTGMDQFMEALNQAANDPSVSQIVLDVDSPGGQVDMVPEAAALIRQVRSKKPVTAVANTMAASAAYWLASQASNLVISPSAEVGSIGVYAGHTDISKAQEALGIKTTLISAGKYKTEGSPFEPLTPDAEAYIQDQVNEYYGMFTRDVASGRNVAVSDVRDGFGQGRMVTAQKAVQMGMGDKVDTFDATVNRALQVANQGLGGNVAMASTNFNGGSINVTFSTPAITEKPQDQLVSDNLLPNAEIPAEIVESDGSVADASSLDSLREASRASAKQEREEYLALLRRINK